MLAISKIRRFSQERKICVFKISRKYKTKHFRSTSTSRLATSIFDATAPFKLYYCIGWGESYVVWQFMSKFNNIYFWFLFQNLL